MEGEGVEAFSRKARANMAVNYWGTKRVCELLGPVLRTGARMVIVSSSLGWPGHLVTPSDMVTCGDKV